MVTDREIVNARQRLIVALDAPTIEDATKILDKVQGHVGVVKVGLELFTACGPAAVEAVKQRGFEVFLDLKLHDIPNTVAGAVRSAKTLGVSMLTVHTGGGEAMLRAAVEAAEDSMRLLGVTLLTSMGPEDLEATGMTGTPKSLVLKRAELAATSGLGGVVCSPKETSEVRGVIRDSMVIVTPGIRPKGAAMGDQKRAATPGSAIGDGSDYLVVGRPITAAETPAESASEIVQEIAEAIQKR